MNDENSFLFFSDANTTFIFYLVVAGGLVGWLLFFFAAVRLVCNNIKRDRPSRQQFSPPTQENVVEIPPPIIHNDSIYDEIDEGPAFPYLITCHSQSYLSVKEDSEKHLNTSTTENNSICESSVSSQNAEDLEHTDALSDNSQESFGECNVNDNDDYLHPYTSLQANDDYPHPYTSLQAGKEDTRC
ncbi:unnamed protein product [Mytilus coruscus]|uniref:Uncharacterized protein n=1 Tax=Mytilus coruscus TaxID=42192 RepID=A0A6J8DYV8_MYTCO|nr:unnamed protein product [Mytilus coruscus]